MQHHTLARSDSLACPICGRPLRRTADHGFAVFECDRCGQFSAFGETSWPPAPRRTLPSFAAPAGTDRLGGMRSRR
jgi:ribosomal protein L37AE/L43A